MTVFNQAFDILMGHEKGYVNDPDDTGGPTNRGITLKTLAEYYGRPCSVEILKVMTIEDAAAVYQKLYWDRLGLDQIKSDVLAVVLFDQGVLTGVSTTLARLQKVLGVEADGKPGPTTVAAANREDGELLAFRFIRASIHGYAKIVAANPSQAKFFGGWSDRLFSLLDFVFFGDAL